MADPSPADRMALAVCPNIRISNGHGCAVPCNTCRRTSAAVAHEIARQLRERHGGSSQVADWLDGVGCHSELIRFDEGSTQRGNGHGGPTTPKPPAKPQPHGG